MQKRTTLTRTVALALIATCCVMAGRLSLAKPSEGIQKLMDTPASAFDVYLHKLYVQLNGRTFFGHTNSIDTVSVSRLEYDEDANVIHLCMLIKRPHGLLEGFAQAGPELKRNILLTAAQEMAHQVGIERKDGVPGGAIQAVRIHEGWIAPGLDEDRVKKEIASRIDFVLTVPPFNADPKDRMVYEVRRTLDGRYVYESFDPRNPPPHQQP